MLIPIGRNEKIRNSTMIGVSAMATKRIRAACPGARDRARPAPRPRAGSDHVTVDISVPSGGGAGGEAAAGSPTRPDIMMKTPYGPAYSSIIELISVVILAGESAAF